MAKESKIPKEIRDCVPCKCCRLRQDSDTVYRVYRYRSEQLASGKWSNNYGELIGKIVAGEGFIANKRYLRELEESQELPFSDSYTDVTYGTYDLLMCLSEDVWEKLKECFIPERAAQIYCYALILCANGFLHIDQVDSIFQDSFLALRYQSYSFKMGRTALTNMLRDLGKRGNPVNRFEQSLIDNCSGNIAVDGHVIRSCSEENDLADPGYKFRQIKSPQVNLLIAYDIKNKIPLIYETFRGSSVDKCSVIDFLESHSFKNTEFIVDRGFYSCEVLGAMSHNGNCYIIPAPSNTNNFKQAKKNLSYTDEFVYKPNKNESSRIRYYEERIDPETRVIVFRDEDENNSKRKNYRDLMDTEPEKYTQEGYDKYCEWWGVYFLQTSTEKPAPEVYKDYKARWSIETYNNYIKNDADFNDLMIQDYYVQHGFDFIMLVTGLIHSRLNEAVKKLNKPSVSTLDILILANHMKMKKEDDKWALTNYRTKDLGLLQAMGFRPRRSYPIVNKTH